MSLFRPIIEIEKDFASVLVSRLSATELLEKLKRLWDEANIAAGELVLTVEVAPYLSLLKRMQDAFDRRDYADRLARRDDYSR